MEPTADPSQSPSNVTNENEQQNQPQTEEKKPFSFTTEGMPSVIKKKISGLVHLLNQDVIQMESLKKCLAEGIPDEAAIIREYCWKIILGYLPEQKSKWQATIEKQNQTYQSLVKMFLPEQKFPDYPLWLKKNHPRFSQLESDYLLWQQIQKDTSRTHAQFSFFATPCPQIMLPYLTSARREKFKLINGEDQESYKQFLANKQKQRKIYRYDYMTRILYIYAKLNPKIQYVQGMNEILAPIFYLVNVTKSAAEMEEAACFFMFNNAICEIIELHIKDFDKRKDRIHGKLNEVNEMLMVIEPNIWKRMEELKIDPFFYCFRWVTLLYAQDFPLFDTLRIWQGIFSSHNRMLYINFFAIGILISCQDFINENQFTVVLEHLQDIKDHIIINQIMNLTNELLEQYQDVDFMKVAQKQKKKVAKEIQKSKEKKQRELAREERQREKGEERQRRKEERQRLQLQKSESQEGQVTKEGDQKGEDGNVKKVQKKMGGLFKKMGNMVGKFLN